MSDDAASGAVAVELRGLARSFGDVAAVEGLDFQVRPGELFGLVGPDGAGKTTTLRMLAGVLRPTSGDAVILGRSVAEDPEAVKPDLAYMSQRFGLYGDLTVRENLDFYADLYEVSPEEKAARLERLYRFSGLEPFQDRLAGDLSGGMKQKLGLSCALIHQPRLLLLDEPTFGVDPISRRDLWLIVHEMVAEGVTVIVSTAYMDEAERFDRLVLLQEGRVVALDTPEALRGELRGRVVAVRGSAPPRTLRDASLELSVVVRAAVFGDRIHATVQRAERDAPALADALGKRGFEDVEVEEVEPSMEDVYLERTADAREAA